MKRSHVVVAFALITALGVAVPVLAVTQGGVSSPTKKAIRKEVARQIAKLQLPQGKQGDQGQQGPQGNPGSRGSEGLEGPPGTPDTSNFYDKAQSDARFAQIEPSIPFNVGLWTNYVQVSPANGTDETVLTLPEGFIVSCASNNTTASSVSVSGGPPSWLGVATQTQTSGTGVQSFVVGSAPIGGTVAFGTNIGSTVRFHLMNTSAAAPTRLWTITVTLFRDFAAFGIANGPHCFAEATAGPA
jgi:hypothetical protein